MGRDPVKNLTTPPPPSPPLAQNEEGVVDRSVRCNVICVRVITVV